MTLGKLEVVFFYRNYEKKETLSYLRESLKIDIGGINGKILFNSIKPEIQKYYQYNKN